MDDPTPPKRSWSRRLPSRLSLRVLMLLVLALGGGLGWVVHRARVQREAVLGIERAGGSVRYNGQGGQITRPRWLRAPRWLVEKLGLDLFDVVVACSLKDAQAGRALSHIGRLSRLEYLDLRGTTFTSEDLSHLEGLGCLRTLNLSRSSLTDQGMPHLTGLHGLQTLNLNETRVSDAGLRHLGEMVRMRSLHLGNTDAGDRTLALVGRMPDLGFLSLIGTKVSDEGVPHLTGLRRLRVICLDDGPGREVAVTDVGLAHLSALGNLSRLTLGRRVTVAGVEHLRLLLPKAWIGLP